MAKSLAELASFIGIRPQPGWDEVEIDGICEHTRRLRPNHLFVAIPGHDRDGSDFIALAIDQGAAAVLTEKQVDLPVPVLKVACARTALAQVAAAFYDHPTSELFTVGVTGTNGKTTTCHWVADLLGRSETLLLSTVRNPATAISGLTTPPSPIIQQLARRAVDDGACNMIIEASSAGIAQDRVGNIDFDVCVFTNFAPEHMRHHGGLAAYRSAKLKLFESMNQGACAVLNADDAIYPDMTAATAARVLSYGIDSEADVRAADIQLDVRGSRFTVVIRGEEAEDIIVPLPGRHHIYNSLAAICVGLVKEIPLSLIADRLSRTEPVPGRAEFFRRPDGIVAMVDFAHNAASLEAMLKWLRSKYSGVIVMFGCPGDGEHEKRVTMGEVAGRYADMVVLTSDNPNREHAGAIAAEIQQGIGASRTRVMINLDRRQAIRLALSQASEGDIILLAGKGHESGQLVKGEQVPFSDADELRTLGFTADY